VVVFGAFAFLFSGFDPYNTMSYINDAYVLNLDNMVFNQGQGCAVLH
jgi:hypothetical protein